MTKKYYVSPVPTGDPETWNSNYIKVLGNKVLEYHFDSTCAGSSRSKIAGEIIYFCIPFKYFPSDVDKAALEKAFKSWIIFGRKFGFYVEYHGQGDAVSTAKKCNPDLWVVPSTNSDMPGLVISWKTGELQYPGHSLEILSFFRYFYSFQSNSVYTRSVELKNTYPEMTEMTCFWAAHILSKIEKTYDSYYGFFIANLMMKRGLLLIPSLAELNARRISAAGGNDDGGDGEVNLVWSIYYDGETKKCTKEEYFKHSGIKGMSDTLFKSIEASGETGIEQIKDIHGNIIPCPEFVDGLLNSYETATLDKYLEKFLNLYEQN